MSKDSKNNEFEKSLDEKIEQELKRKGIYADVSSLQQEPLAEDEAEESHLEHYIKFMYQLGDGAASALDKSPEFKKLWMSLKGTESADRFIKLAYIMLGLATYIAAVSTHPDDKKLGKDVEAVGKRYFL